MHEISRFLGVVTLCMSVMVPALAGAAERLQPFMAGGPVTTKEELVARITGDEFQADRAAVVKLFNHDVSPVIGRTVANFNELIVFVMSDEVTVQQCDWKIGDRVEVYGVRSKRSFGTLTRDCYPGELVLAYRGRAFLSLACANLILDARAQARKGRLQSNSYYIDPHGRYHYVTTHYFNH